MSSTGLPGLILVLLPTLQKVWLHLHKILCHTHPYYIKLGSGYPLGKLGQLQPSNTTFYSTRIYARSLGVYCDGTMCNRTMSHECGGNKPDTAFSASTMLALGLFTMFTFLFCTEAKLKSTSSSSTH